MRFFIIAMLVVGCTKPNPNICCTNEADCSSNGIPIGSVCEQGLVCRGNQCIAQPCNSSEQCDAAAPYCIDELCAEQCTEDTHCPGAGETAEMFCVAGSCVICRSSSDCAATVPVCDGGACRTCTSHDECGSQVCDAGACVPETEIAYASPNGSSSSGCTQQAPCTLERAMAVVDSTRNNIKLLPGTFAAPAGTYLEFRSSFQLTIYGPATVEARFAVYVPSPTVMASMRLRDLTSTSGAECSPGGSLNPVPSVELDRVIVDITQNQMLGPAVNASRCKVAIRDSSIRVTVPATAALLSDGPGGAGGQLALVERSLLDVSVPTNAAVVVSLDGGASLQMRNSVVRGGSATIGAIGFGTSVSPSVVAFTTFYNTTLQCPTGNVILESQNNIFLNEQTDAPASTVTGSACSHRYVLAKPQAGAIAGSNNMVNVDPRFANGANNDFHLIAGSPAIDAADPAATEAVDLEGTMRPQGAARDLGAFEYK